MAITFKKIWKTYDAFMSKHGFRIVNALLIVLGILQGSITTIVFLSLVWIHQEVFQWVMRASDELISVMREYINVLEDGIKKRDEALKQAIEIINEIDTNLTT